MSACRIRAISAIVPSRRRTKEDLARLLGESEADRIGRLTGIEETRIAAKGERCYHLAHEVASRLLCRLEINPSEIDGVLLFTQTPEFVAPSTACLLQDRLGLPQHSIAFDVNLGCSALPYALAIGRSLIGGGLARRLLLLIGDTISSRISANDRATLPLFGDAIAAVLLEAADGGDDILGMDLGTDGSGWPHLTVPVGQCRYPTVAEFHASADEKLRKVQFPDCLSMDGNQIFAFTQRQVPGIVERTLRVAQKSLEDVDYFLFHQANKFIHDHLVQKMQLPPDRCPLSVRLYGNTGGASPALTACHAIAETNRLRELTAMFVAFGIGYSWGGVLARLRPGVIHPVEEF